MVISAADRFERSARSPVERPVRGGDQQRGRDHQVSAEVSKPPGAPHRVELASGYRVGHEEARHTEGRAYRGAERAGDDQCNHVPHALEARAEAGETAQEIRADQGLERVADGDPEHRVQRDARPTVRQKGTDCDRGPHPAAPQDNRRKRDARRRPDRRDASGLERELEAELRRSVVDRGDTDELGRVEPEVTVHCWSAFGECDPRGQC